MGTGSTDVGGNVWEWTSDWYRPNYYAQLAAAGGVARNPQGPDTPFDPSEPTEKKRVHRGGSFLCTDQYCSRYMVGTRGKGEGSTGTNHLGFRTVRSPESRKVPAAQILEHSSRGTTYLGARGNSVIPDREWRSLRRGNARRAGHRPLFGDAPRDAEDSRLQDLIGFSSTKRDYAVESGVDPT